MSDYGPMYIIVNNWSVYTFQVFFKRTFHCYYTSAHKLYSECNAHMKKYLLISVQLFNEFDEVCIVENDYFAQVYHIDSNIWLNFIFYKYIR